MNNPFYEVRAISQPEEPKYDYSKCKGCGKEFVLDEEIREIWESFGGFMPYKHIGNLCIACYDEREGDEDGDDYHP